MQIQGACHCSNITYTLEWPGDAAEIPVRVCGCTFCRKHGGAYTSHRDAALNARVKEPEAVSRYAFGTGTAEFFVCARCGAVPFVSSEIDGRLYAVVNTNTFDEFDPAALIVAPTDFEGESTTDRLARRQRGWIPSVQIDGL